MYGIWGSPIVIIDHIISRAGSEREDQSILVWYDLLNEFIYTLTP